MFLNFFFHLKFLFFSIIFLFHPKICDIDVPISNCPHERFTGTNPHAPRLPSIPSLTQAQTPQVQSPHHRAEARFLPNILSTSCPRGLRQFSLSLFSLPLNTSLVIFSHIFFIQTYTYLIFLNSPRSNELNFVNCLVAPPP